jgi:hypothetical protein
MGAINLPSYREQRRLRVIAGMADISAAKAVVTR